MACVNLYSNVNGPYFYNADFVVDERMREVHVFHDGYWVYTDGIQPREILAYEEYKDNIYSLGVYPTYGSSSDWHTYTLHKCEASFTLCQQLPFLYTDTGGSFEIKFDESTDELKVYTWNWKTDEEVLIYLYGAEPKCYVEGCTIPDE